MFNLFPVGVAALIIGTGAIALGDVPGAGIVVAAGLLFITIGYFQRGRSK